MKRTSIILSISLCSPFCLIGNNYAFASLLPLTESGLNSAKTRTQEREIQNLKNQVNQNNYSNPTKSTTDLIMEMTQQNMANEKLKEEIMDEVESQKQISQPIKTKEEICKDSMGDNSRYNSSSKKCECVEEYKLFKNKCLSKLEYGNEYCQETLGINSMYDNENDKCLTNEDYCKEKMGYGARYSIGDEQCQCADGFVLVDNSCAKEKKEEIKIEPKPSSFSGRIINFFQKLKFW